MELRACQERHNELLFPAIEAGENRIVVTSPTGSGKSKMIEDLLTWAGTGSVFTHRRILRDQISKNLNNAGIDHGIRASGYKEATLKNIQLVMQQTEFAKVYKAKSRQLHQGRVAVFDECHLQRGASARQIISDFTASGVHIVGYTATPLNLGDVYKTLVVVGTMSECIFNGDLVPCQLYAPDEPELKHIRNIKIGEDLTDGQNVKAIMRAGIAGRVEANYRASNPDGHPTILFAPGVPESIWFAKDLSERGIRSASIDGKNIWLDGGLYDSTPEMRAEVAEQSRNGDIKIVCNRFVLREGVDWPWLRHGILACVFGSLTSYLQATGRLLRSHHDKALAVIQDHGGNHHRHGSPDVDQQWNLAYTDAIMAGLRQDGLREKREAEPITCPMCFAVRFTGAICHICGHRCGERTRLVVQSDGRLKAVAGEIYKPRRVKTKPDTLEVWKHYWHIARKSKTGMTYNQARGYFAYKERYWPPADLPMMPIDALDWYRRVRDIPKERLRS